MAENKVVIEFVGDVSGLKPAIDTLSQLGNLSEEQVNAFKKANDQFKQANKSAVDTEKSVSKLSTSFKQISGAVAGKAIAEPLKELTKATEQATTKTVSLKTELRALKAQIAQLDEGTAEFERLTQRAAKLEDQIGDVNERVRVLASDTFKFDAAVGAIRGVTAAFSVAQGAAALFGEENEDVQKALLKVQAATALLTGVQELANIATGQGALKLGILSAAQKVQTFVTSGATLALRAFNAALIATGVGAAIAALGAIVAYWEDIAKFIGISNDGQKEFKAQQEKLDELAKKRKEEIQEFNKQYEGTIGQARLDLELAEKRGASEKEILALKKFLNIAQQEEIRNKINSGLLSEEAIKRENTKLQILKAELEGLNKVKKTKEEISKVPLTLSILVDEEETRKQAKKTAEVFIRALKDQDFAGQLGELLGKVEVPPIKIPVELQKAVDIEKYLKEQLPQDVIRAVSTITDSIFQIANQTRQAEFEEEMMRLDERRDKELSNKNLTESQKAAIDKRYKQQEQALKLRQFNADKQAAIAQATINGALAVTNALATVKPLIPAGIAAAALAGISTAAQIAVISSQKAPKFAKGGFIGGKSHSQGGTIIEAEKDEFVVRKSIAKQNKSFLEAFNNGVPIAKALEKTSFMPSIKDNDLIVLENKANIDYSKLGRAVAREMSKLPQSELEVNYRGLFQSINSQQSLIEWQKRKYN